MPKFKIFTKLVNIKEKILKWDETRKTKGNKGLLFFGIIAVIIFAFLGIAGKATSSSAFCTVCHEMAPEVATWEVTSHAKLDCVQCHTEPGAGNYIKSKLDILRFGVKHLIRNKNEVIVDPVPVSNQVCEDCHSLMRQVTPSGDISIPHAKHLNQGISCVACHSGVAHAFVAERGLTVKVSSKEWTAEKAKEVSTFDETKTAMEACMECHEMYNMSQKPWLDNGGQASTEEQRVNEQQQLAEEAKNATGDLSSISVPAMAIPTGTGSTPQAPMSCTACHTEIKTPTDHQQGNWKETHGKKVADDPTYCASCHSRQRERALVTKQTEPRDYARSNVFCADCHVKRPPSHLSGKQEWLPAHPNVISKNGIDGCIVCHDVQPPKDPNAPPKPGVNGVYCNTCHWF